MIQREQNQGDVCIANRLDIQRLEVMQKKQDATGLSTKDVNTVFTLDEVFQPGSQKEIFAEVKELTQSVLDGYNATIFAYGQTGSGKTYTMAGEAGSEEGQGLIPRTIEHLYKVMNDNKD